jgi:hypothetical protein
MPTLLTSFTRGFVAEYLKHRHTFMIWFIFLVPLVATSIIFLTVYADNNLRVTDPWRWFIAFNFKPYFHIFVLLQILFTANLNYIEHKNNTWKVIHVMPVPFRVTFLSKIAFGYVVFALNVAIFFTLMMFSGTLLGILRPDTGFQRHVYLMEAFIPAVKFFLASMAVAAIMYWISAQFKTLLVSVVSGISLYALAFTLFLITSRQGYTGLPYAEYHPFNFSAYAFNSFGTGSHSLNLEFVYYGLGVAILVLASHYFFRRYKNVQ